MSEQFGFKRAQRIQARLRLGVSGVSGAGKTMGSLRLAKGIVQALLDTGQVEGDLTGKIAMIDTERKSAALYAHVVPFDTLELDPPYSVDRYQQAIAAAEHAGYTVCIIDQISHAWAGPGGQLEWIDTLKAGARNQISPWAKITPIQQEFYDRMLRSPMHIIATMRAKSEYVIEEQIVDGRKKSVPRKIGLSPVQRDGIEYEFTSMLDVDLESHMATASKDRTSLFMDRQTKLDEDTGRKLAEWLVSGAAPVPEAARQDAGDEEAKRKAGLLAQLEADVSEYQLGFIDCSTLPDLAAHFDKAQKHARSFVKDLGPEAVKPFLDRLVESKDVRKSKIGLPPAPEKVDTTDVKKLESLGAAEGLTQSEILDACGVKQLADLEKAKYADATDRIGKSGRAKKAGPGKPAAPRRQRAAA